MQNQFQFSLLGSTIALRSNSERTYMEQVFRHLEGKVAATQQSLHLRDALQTAIVTAFLLVDEVLAERAESRKLLSQGLEAEQLLEELSRELCDLLQEDK